MDTQSESQLDQAEKAISTVNETAKGLYTFLTPLATAVATYFFSQQQSR